MGWAGHRMLARKVELILKGPVRILPGESEDAGEGVIPDRGTGTGKGTKGTREHGSFGNFQSYPGGSEWKESACNAGDLGSIPGLGRSPGEGNGTHSSILAWRVSWTEEPGRL